MISDECAFISDEDRRPPPAPAMTTSVMMKSGSG
jgi:hypothetical protein